MPSQKFGGGWTEQKLRILDDYLAAYCKIFQVNPRAKHFDTIYVDAFAGTGLIEQQAKPADGMEFFAEFAERETVEFLKGSASRALQHPFTQYIFIEKSASRITELEKLRAKSLHKHRIRMQKGDANKRLGNLVNSTDWKKCRAVVFLDPYGMQVDWETIEKLGKTKAIDLWFLFPLVKRSCDCCGKRASLPQSGRKLWIEYLELTTGTHGFTSPSAKPISSKRKLSRHIVSPIGRLSGRS